MDNSLKTKEKPPESGEADAPRKRQTKTFLIGKELKTKDLRQTAERRASGSHPKTRIKTPGLAYAEGRVKPLARLLRCATALRVTAPLGCGSRRLGREESDPPSGRGRSHLLQNIRSLVRRSVAARLATHHDDAPT